MRLGIWVRIRFASRTPNRPGANPARRQRGAFLDHVPRRAKTQDEGDDKDEKKIQE